MYPLNVILIGNNSAELPQIREALYAVPANIIAEVQDVAMVLANLRAEDEERCLFVVYVESFAALEPLSKLARAFGGWPILAILDSAQDHRVVLSTMRAGATQIVTLPLHDEDLRAALECIAGQFATTSKTGSVISITSPKGGGGVSTVALNLASEVAHLAKKPTILVDMSLQMGVLASFLDLQPQYTIQNVLQVIETVDQDYMRQVLTPVAPNFSLLAAPNQNFSSEPVRTADIARMIGMLRRLAFAVVIDLPCNYSDLFFEVLANSDQVVLLAEQQIPSIRALKLLKEALSRQPAIRTQTLVINRYNPKVQGFTIEHLKDLLHAAELLTIVNDHNAVSSAVNHGRVLRVEAPRSPVLADIGRLATALNLVQTDDEEQQPAANIFSRMVQALGLTNRRKHVAS